MILLVFWCFGYISAMLERHCHQISPPLPWQRPCLHMLRIVGQGNGAELQRAFGTWRPILLPLKAVETSRNLGHNLFGKTHGKTMENQLFSSQFQVCKPGPEDSIVTWRVDHMATNLKDALRNSYTVIPTKTKVRTEHILKQKHYHKILI